MMTLGLHLLAAKWHQQAIERHHLDLGGKSGSWHPRSRLSAATRASSTVRPRPSPAFTDTATTSLSTRCVARRMISTCLRRSRGRTCPDRPADTLVRHVRLPVAPLPVDRVPTCRRRPAGASPSAPLRSPLPPFILAQIAEVRHRHYFLVLPDTEHGDALGLAAGDADVVGPGRRISWPRSVTSMIWSSSPTGKERDHRPLRGVTSMLATPCAAAPDDAILVGRGALAEALGRDGEDELLQHSSCDQALLRAGSIAGTSAASAALSLLGLLGRRPSPSAAPLGGSIAQVGDRALRLDRRRGAASTWRRRDRPPPA